MSGWWRLVVFVCLPAVPATLLAQAGAPIVHRGALASGDQQLRSGEYYDTYEFQGRAGQRVVFDLTSTAFDPYLMVVAPSGHKEENDDYNGSNTRSRLELALEETGTCRVLVTSYKKDETGAYELRIGSGGAAPAEPGVRTESGRLAAGDSTLGTGEYRDAYTFQGRRGQLVTVDLRSAEFDTYLIVIDPSGKHHENDDHEGDSHRSLVSYELPEDGAYRIIVTSYRGGEAGAYDLRIQTGTASGVTAGAATGPRVEHGRLAAGDDTLRSGEYVDRYTFDGRPGQRVTIDVVSNEFDTYLMLIPPRGDRWENDDVDDRPHHSVIEADLTEAGQYRVMVTSYKRGETPGRAAPPPRAKPAVRRPRGVAACRGSSSGSLITATRRTTCCTPPTTRAACTRRCSAASG